MAWNSFKFTYKKKIITITIKIIRRKYISFIKKNKNLK